MSDPTRGTDRGGRRSKRFLTPSQKYEIFLQLIRQEVTMAEAAEAWKVDRTTILRIRVHRHVIPWRFRHGIPSLGVQLSSR